MRLSAGLEEASVIGDIQFLICFGCCNPLRSKWLKFGWTGLWDVRSAHLAYSKTSGFLGIIVTYRFKILTL